jgi:perosamine synthetase
MAYQPHPDHPLTVACPWFPPEERAWLHSELEDILVRKLSMGPRTAAFEQAFARYCGVEHGIALPSCTAALESALIALGVQPGDEVLVPVQTFVATGMAVQLVGARPVFVEVNPATFAMDFADALAKCGPRTKGAIVVHFGGFIAPDLLEFVASMHGRGLFVIEDAAHAHGAELDGRKAGALADAACFSFYPTKIMTTGEGGMVVTSNQGLANTVRSLQNRGLDLANPDESYVRAGRNNRFSETAAAMGLSQLRCLPGFLAARRAVAAIYDQALDVSGLFDRLRPGPGVVPSYWRYVAVPRRPLDRIQLKSLLAAEGITIDWAYEPPMHLQPVFRQLYGTAPGLCPRSEALMSRHLCLPIHARLRPEDAEHVATRVLHHAAQLVP